MPSAGRDVRTTEQRLARLSVLQELTVTALDLFDPESPEDPFLERVAERLGCLVALWVAIEPDGRPRLIGAAGLSEASRALPFGEPPADGDPTTLAVGYPELQRIDLLRWSLELPQPPAPGAGRHALLLWFDSARRPPEEYLPVVERLAGVLSRVLVHRRLTLDLRRSYEVLARTQLALVERERLAAIGELAAVVAHEVRNPLAVIFNCVSNLSKGGGEPEDQSALLSILSEEAHRLNQIVSELLEFARPGELRLSAESLEDIVVSAIAAVRAAQTPVIAIELSVEHPLPPQQLDARLVRRAVINLVTNAVQVTPEGARVRVRLCEGTMGGKPASCIEVTDEGPGIPAGVDARVFEPFFTTKASGVGLGLSIVKQVAEAHGGDVAFRAAEGGGATFVIRLPRSAP